MKKFFYIFLLLGAVFTLCLLMDKKISLITTTKIYQHKSAPFEKVILVPSPDAEGVFLYLVFPSGEASHTFDEGLAHYVEHLAWLSAFGGDQDERALHSNAWTNHFSTGYWRKTSKEDLHHAMQTLISVANPLKVDADFALEERKIVLREHDFRVTERPLYNVFRDMDRALYGDGTLARSVIGQPPVIASYALDAAATLHKETHILAEATLLVYGNISQARLDAVLSSLSFEGASAPKVNPVLPKMVSKDVMQDRAAVTVSRLNDDTFLYRKLVRLGPCDSPAHCATVVRLAENALESALPGGLAGPLRFDQFVARSFSFDIQVIGTDYVEVYFSAHPDNGVSLKTLETAFHATLQNTLKNGLHQGTFDRVKSRLQDQLNNVLERDRPNDNRGLLLDQLMFAKPIFSLEDQINAVEGVRLKDVNSFLKTLLAEGRDVTRLVTVER